MKEKKAQIKKTLGAPLPENVWEALNVLFIWTEKNYVKEDKENINAFVIGDLDQLGEGSGKHLYLGCGNWRTDFWVWSVSKREKENARILFSFFLIP